MINVIPRLAELVRIDCECDVVWQKTESVAFAITNDDILTLAVERFELIGHGKAAACYAWFADEESRIADRAVIVLFVPPMLDVMDAVRSAIRQP